MFEYLENTDGTDQDRRAGIDRCWPQYRLRSIPNSLSSLCELRPFRYCTARDTDRLGGIDNSMCT